MPAAEKMLSVWRQEIARMEKTEKEKCIRRLTEILDFNEGMLNTSSIGILTYRASGKCVFANKAAGMIVGTTAEKLMEQDFHKIKSWKRSGMHKAALKALKTNEEQCLDSHITTTFGKDVWLRNRFSRFVSGGERHLLLFISEITGLKKAAEELRIAEEKYRTIVESATDQIFMVERRLRVVSANKRMAARVGRPAKELMGRHVSELFPEETAARLVRNCRHVLETGVGISTEERIPADGKEAYISISLNPVMDSQRRIVAVAGIVRDITKTKGTEEALKESGRHYRSLFDNSPVALMEVEFSEVRKLLDRMRGQGIINIEGAIRSRPDKLAAAVKRIRVLDMNLATTRLFESKNKDAAARRLQELLLGELSGDFTRQIVHLLKKGKTSRMGISVRNGPRGKPFSAIVETTFIPGSESSWKKVMISISDVTELKRAQEEVRRGTEELEKLSAAAVGMEMELIDLRRKIRKLESEKR